MSDTPDYSRVPDSVRRVLAQVAAQRGLSDDETPAAESSAAPKPLLMARSIAIPRAKDPAVCEDDILAWCAALDHSDTDNAYRLIAHFGRDLLVMAQEKARANLFLVWTGTHWDTATGNPRSLALAQELGARIAEEVNWIRPTDAEASVLDKAAGARAKAEADRNAAEKRLVDLAEKIEDRIGRRHAARIKHAVTSKNVSRLSAMRECAAPHLLTDPDAFNANHYRVAVAGHTLDFAVTSSMQPNPDADMPGAPPGTPAMLEVRDARVKATKGHRREDLITEVIPVHYKPGAKCPKWDAFLAEFQPRPEVRRLVQVSSGLGLLGITVQKLFFHYGNGANGKSVFLETVVRVLGEASVTLPAESFFGAAGQGGGATPDIARLHGRRYLRVQELPEGEDLREDLVKKLTGGEEISVRDLFQGYFDFKPLFTGHMSGNGYPKINGTDNGIWRRMAVILWPVTVADDRQRNFEEVVSDFESEYSGILNWLIEGALIYLSEGLVIPKEVERETQKFRDEMDPTAGFVNRCVKPDKIGDGVGARDFYNAYCTWCLAEASKPISETRFGKIMSKRYQREDGRTRRYLGIRLDDVPSAPAGRGDYPDDYGGRS